MHLLTMFIVKAGAVLAGPEAEREGGDGDELAEAT